MDSHPKRTPLRRTLSDNIRKGCIDGIVREAASQSEFAHLRGEESNIAGSIADRFRETTVGTLYRRDCA